MASPLGPVRPRKPKPKKQKLANNEFCWMDSEDTLAVGTELFVCIQEDPAVFDLLQSGVYTTEDGNDFTVSDGVVVSIP